MDQREHLVELLTLLPCGPDSNSLPQLAIGGRRPLPHGTALVGDGHQPNSAVGIIGDSLDCSLGHQGVD